MPEPSGLGSNIMRSLGGALGEEITFVAEADMRTRVVFLRPLRGLRFVRFWHKADMLNALTNVRFWGQSGPDADTGQCPLMTQSGHLGSSS